MSVVQEIIHEAKQQTSIKLKRNCKRLLATLGIVSLLMSITFYVLGFPYQDSLYRQLPFLAGVPILAMASFNAFAITSIVMFFLKSLGDVTSSTVKNSLEQRRENKIKTQAKAIVDRVDQYGQRDYSLQIDEVKQGLEYQIDTTNKRVDVNDYDIQQLKENTERFEPHLARQNRNDYDFNWRLENLEKTINEIKQILVNKKPQNTISLDEYNILHEQLLKTEEELKNLKGE